VLGTHKFLKNNLIICYI